jgi:hypothetical protein
VFPSMKVVQAGLGLWFTSQPSALVMLQFD